MVYKKSVGNVTFACERKDKKNCVNKIIRKNTKPFERLKETERFQNQTFLIDVVTSTQPSTEHVFYAQVVMLCRKDLKITEKIEKRR